MPVGTSDGLQFKSEFEYVASLLGYESENTFRYQDFHKSDNVEDRRNSPSEAVESPSVRLNEPEEEYPLDNLSKALGLETLDKQLNDPINSLLRKLDGFEETPPPELDGMEPVTP